MHHHTTLKTKKNYKFWSQNQMLILKAIKYAWIAFSKQNTQQNTKKDTPQNKHRTHTHTTKTDSKVFKKFLRHAKTLNNAILKLAEM